MKRVKLVVAYDGTNYRGWQVQNNGETIESMLNRAISSLTGEEIHVWVPAGQIPVCMPWEMWQCLIQKPGWQQINFLMR